MKQELNAEVLDQVLTVDLPLRAILSINNTTVGDDFPKQQQRARELLAQYQAIGAAGKFGAAVIETALRRADEAAISGDVVAILRSYEELKGLA